MLTPFNGRAQSTYRLVPSDVLEASDVLDTEDTTDICDK